MGFSDRYTEFDKDQDTHNRAAAVGVHARGATAMSQAGLVWMTIAIYLFGILCFLGLTMVEGLELLVMLTAVRVAAFKTLIPLEQALLIANTPSHARGRWEAVRCMGEPAIKIVTVVGGAVLKMARERNSNDVGSGVVTTVTTGLPGAEYRILFGLCTALHLVNWITCYLTKLIPPAPANTGDSSQIREAALEDLQPTIDEQPDEGHRSVSLDQVRLSTSVSTDG